LNTQKQPLNNLPAMKKLITGIFLLLTVNAIAQRDVVEDTTAKSAITGFGKYDGVKTEVKIGTVGGSISSADGVVILIFPEDALSKKTTISIQPVENMAINGNGKGYKMEPSGILFNKPATIVFNYANEDTANNAQALMNIAMQDENGKWFKLNKTVTDTVSKTIIGSINHFSTYVNFSKAKIFPKYARVKVNGSIRLKIQGALYDDTDENVITLTPLNGIIEYPSMIWKVNGIEKGNSTMGYISTSTNGSAIFQAPAKVPEQCLAAISVSPKRNLSSSIAQYNNFFMVSNVLIYDNAYKVTMVHSSNDPGGGGYYGTVNYKDTGSFIVSVTGKEARVIEKENKNTHSYITYKGQCKVVELQPGSGSIHVLGVSGTRVIPPATADGNAWVEIFFKRAPTIFPLLQYTCPHLNGKGTFTRNSAQARAMGAMVPALPISVKFELKDEEQTILQLGNEADGGIIKITVKKLNDE
jgi:hypothetical protein